MFHHTPFGRFGGSPFHCGPMRRGGRRGERGGRGPEESLAEGSHFFGRGGFGRGGEPGSKPTYAAIGYLTFDSVEAFQKAFGPHAAEIVADVPNYTNARPIIQIVEVVT